jgi:hypothetical protein
MTEDNEALSDAEILTDEEIKKLNWYARRRAQWETTIWGIPAAYPVFLRRFRRTILDELITRRRLLNRFLEIDRQVSSIIGPPPLYMRMTPGEVRRRVRDRRSRLDPER